MKIDANMLKNMQLVSFGGARHTAAYSEMLHQIEKDATREGEPNAFAGILFTRPDLESGTQILKSLKYYHYLTGQFINFYFPGFYIRQDGEGADENDIVEIEGSKWSFSNEKFICFCDEMRTHTVWRYSGESDLMLLQLKRGRLNYDAVMVFCIDRMLRDKVIEAISPFFQSLIDLFRSRDTLEEISDALGKKKAAQLVRELLLNRLPADLGKVFVQEQYFRVINQFPKRSF